MVTSRDDTHGGVDIRLPRMSSRECLGACHVAWRGAGVNEAVPQAGDRPCKEDDAEREHEGIDHAAEPRLLAELEQDPGRERPRRQEGEIEREIAVTPSPVERRADYRKRADDGDEREVVDRIVEAEEGHSEIAPHERAGHADERQAVGALQCAYW